MKKSVSKNDFGQNCVSKYLEDHLESDGKDYNEKIKQKIRNLKTRE